MTNKFTIVIGAVDKATALVNKVKASVGKVTRPVKDMGASFSSLGKSAGLDNLTKSIGKVTRPVKDMGASFSSLGKSAGLDNLTKSIGKVGTFTGKTVSSMAGGLGAPMEGLLSVGVGAAAGVAAGAAGLTAAIAAMSAEFGRYSEKLARTSYLSGVSTSQLQSLAGAAKLAGVSSETMQGSLSALGTTMQDALFGRNDQAAAMFSTLGLTIRHTAEGTVDAADMFRQLADKLGDADPKTAAMIAGMLGIDASLIPMMKNLKKSEEAARELGSTMGPEQIARAAAFETSINRLGIAFSGLGRSIADTFIPPLQKGVDKLTELIVVSRKWWSTHSVNAPGTSITYAMPTVPIAPGPGAAQSSLPARAASITPQSQPDNRTPLGLRLNNPGNLRAGAGQIGTSPEGYAIFPTQEAGLSAMVRQIQLYENRDNIRTTNAIVNRYAPDGDGNNVPAYVADVSKRTGLAADQPIDPSDKQTMAALVTAMIQHEQGKQPFSPEQIQAVVDQRMASNSGGQQSGGEPVKVEVSFRDLPQGATAKATSPNASIGPARVSYSMPTTVTP